MNNKKISRFLDNDLSHDETLTLLQTMKEQPELKDTLKRYAAVSHALKTDDFLGAVNLIEILISIYLKGNDKKLKPHAGLTIPLLWTSADFATRIQQEIQQTPIDDVSQANKTRLN